MSLYCTLGFSPFPSYKFKKQVRDGPVAQLVRAPPCHGGGRRFESVPGRSFKEVVSISIEMAFFIFNMHRTSFSYHFLD